MISKYGRKQLVELHLMTNILKINQNLIVSTVRQNEDDFLHVLLT
jgi:hypothetical protein